MQKFRTNSPIDFNFGKIWKIKRFLKNIKYFFQLEYHVDNRYESFAYGAWYICIITPFFGFYVSYWGKDFSRSILQSNISLFLKPNYLAKEGDEIFDMCVRLYQGKSIYYYDTLNTKPWSY